MSDPYDGLPGGPLPEGGSNIVQFPSHSGAGGGGENSDPPTPPSAPREIAKRLYLGLRQNGYPIAGAFSQMMAALEKHRDRLPAEAPPADERLIRAWMVEGDWEGVVRASTSMVVLDSREADPRRYLQDLLRQREAARGIMENLTEQVEGPPPDGYNVMDKGPWPAAGIVHRWQNSQATFISLSREVEAAQQGVVRADREGTRDDYWEGEYEKLMAELMAEYGELGPQYRILVRRLAALDIRLRQTERSGRDIDPSEYKTLNDLHRSQVQALQKHQESLRTESVHDVQEVAKKIVGILERRIKPASAQLWNDVVEDIVLAVGDIGAA